MLFSTLHSYVIPSPLCTSNIFLEECWSDSKTLKRNAVEMSEKCRKHPLSQNKDIKAVHHFEENNYDGDDVHASRNKISLSVQYL